LFFQAVSIKLGLALAYAGVAFGSFGFHQSQRLAVITPEDIIDKALVFAVGHAAHGIFAVFFFVQRPACFLQQKVNEVVTGFSFRVVVLVWRGFIVLLDLGDLDPQSF
jgi:hypothetical protein